MQDKARFFAYSTWVVMISLAMIVFTSRFLTYVSDPGWIGLAALLGFGLIWLNFSYFIVKRFIKKSAEATALHIALAVLIFIPPGSWIIFVNNSAGRSAFILFVVIAFACGLGAWFGRRSGYRERQEILNNAQSS